MNVFDRSILRLPLFEDRHRDLAHRIESWLADAEPRIAGIRSLPPAQAGRRLTAILADDGWLKAVGLPDHDLDFRALVLIREGMAYLDDLCDFAMSIQVLSAAAIKLHGTRDQRDAWLPDLASGALIGSFALSEPEVGSDLAHIGLEARPEGDRFVLRGTKTWISNADIADVHIVLARTGEGPGPLGLTVFAVPTDSPGLSVSQTINLTAPRSIGTLRFDDCTVPRTAVLGKPGIGFQIATGVLERFRLTVGAAAIGFARRARGAALGWSRTRRLTEGTVWDKQVIRSRFADGEVALTAASLLVAQAAWAVDTGHPDIGKQSSIAKLFATEQAQGIVDDAVQILGAAGLVLESVTERLYRQIRSLRIYEGTSEIQRLIIADTLRAIRT